MAGSLTLHSRTTVETDANTHNPSTTTLGALQTLPAFFRPATALPERVIEPNRPDVLAGVAEGASSLWKRQEMKKKGGGRKRKPQKTAKAAAMAAMSG